MSTGLLWNRPRLGWRASSQALYTIVLIDTGIEALEVEKVYRKDGDYVKGQGAQYFHWIVTNVPGLDLGAGAEVMEYIPPFQVSFLP